MRLDTHLQLAKRAGEFLRELRHLVGVLLEDEAAHEGCGLLWRQVVKDSVQQQLGDQQLVTATAKIKKHVTCESLNTALNSFSKLPAIHNR